MTMEEESHKDMDGLGSIRSESGGASHEIHTVPVVAETNSENEPKSIENSEQEVVEYTNGANVINGSNEMVFEPQDQGNGVEHSDTLYDNIQISTVDKVEDQAPIKTFEDNTQKSPEPTETTVDKGSEIPTKDESPIPKVETILQDEQKVEDLSQLPVRSQQTEKKDEHKESDEVQPEDGYEQPRAQEPSLPLQAGALAELDTDNHSNKQSFGIGEHSQSSLPKEEEDSSGLHTQTTETPKPSDLYVPQSHEIVIPSYARWFHLQKIHSLEKQSLPEFFTNRIPSKTPQVYVKYRNFMVNSYRLNPNEYFTMTAARRNLCGDAGAILRLHKFLTKWGLINYQVNAKTKPKQVEPPFTGDFTTKHDAPRGLFPFESYKPAIQIPDLSRLKKLMHQIDSPGDHSKADYSNDLTTPTENEKKRPSEEGTDTRTTSSKLQRPNVFDTIDKDWSKQDLEKLLKGLQMFKSDWQKVANFVGNKTAEECILRFLQLPIEDPYLQSQSCEELGPLKYAPHLPFSKADNPVMSTIAFLVGLVDPELVKKMTNRAIDSLKNDGQSEIPKSEDYIKEGSELAIASLGARAHVFATNEERQINALANELTQAQMKKVNLKLKLLGTMEKSLEMEKKALQKQQEDVLVHRLSLAKHSQLIASKLQQCIDDHDDKKKLEAHLSELKEIQNRPARVSLGRGMSSTPSANGTPREQGQKSLNDANNSFVTPVSINAPQAYRYWSG
ncbi:LADA_0E04060g1_1 [Lachancea dasiensis]|uniref:LADA_0E04060g1_1 n=1 Tax=Lachancea dasiensis TaxID=1072105 RepID=A0A1G4JBI3_9SACH|nr:LADA_0E04060g1_1 [Lachancea dasiensis]